MNAPVPTEQIIQRLVDGQLDSREREQFLQTAEQQPGLWRQLALAYVEDRVWASAIAGEPEPRHLRESPLKPAAEASGGMARSSVWLALAATALLVITVGVRLASLPDNGQAVGVIPAPETSLASGPYMLEMGDGGLQIPLYRQLAPLRDRLTRFESGPDPGLLRLFNNAGYDLNPGVRYITGNAPDGMSFIVPVQQYRIQSRIQ